MSSDQLAAVFERRLLERVSCDWDRRCHHRRRPSAHSVELIFFCRREVCSQRGRLTRRFTRELRQVRRRHRRGKRGWARCARSRADLNQVLSDRREARPAVRRSAGRRPTATFFSESCRGRWRLIASSRPHAIAQTRPSPYAIAIPNTACRMTRAACTASLSNGLIEALNGGQAKLTLASQALTPPFIDWGRKLFSNEARPAAAET
jgi:hypothetical protein